jgi:hypothetical protein
MGASLWVAPAAASTFTAIYQREILSDRSGLVSERAALDARLGLSPRLLLTGSADADLAFQTWGKARLGALIQLQRHSFVELEVFRYRPILDLTTIWGVFSPQAHRGVSATARVAASSSVTLSGGFTYRHYQPITTTTPFLTDAGDDAKLFSGGARVSFGDVVLDGTYRLQLDFGGAQSSGDFSLAYAPPGRWRGAVRTSAFQQEGQFRVADGTVYGLGGELSARLGDRLAVRGELTRYWHRRPEGQAAIDWSQTRGLLTIDWTFGANPDRPGPSR